MHYEVTKKDEKKTTLIQVFCKYNLKQMMLIHVHVICKKEQKV